MSRSFSVTEMVALVRKHTVYIIHSIYSWDLQLITVTFLSNRNRIRFRLSRLTRPIIVMITHFEVPASACIWWHTHSHTDRFTHTHTNIVGIINNIAKLINFSIWKTSAPFARFGVLRPTPRGIFAISERVAWLELTHPQSGGCSQTGKRPAWPRSGSIIRKRPAGSRRWWAPQWRCAVEHISGKLLHGTSPIR